MSPEDYISQAIDAGEAGGLEELGPTQRAVFLISEAEVCCDMGSGLESLVRKHGAETIKECSEAFLGIGATEIGISLSTLSPKDLETDQVNRAEQMISERSCYEFGDIATWVSSQTGEIN